MLFSSVTGLPSTTSAAGVSTGFVRQLRWYYAVVRLLARVHARIILLAFPCRSGGWLPRILARSLGSRACSFSTCSWLLDYAGSVVNIAFSLTSVSPSRWEHSVGIQIAFFEARFPARRCLCLCFTRLLTLPSARLEVKMVRYSFLVGLLPPRLHAGLSRRLHSAHGHGSVCLAQLLGNLRCSA